MSENEVKSQRMQLRITEDMGTSVRALAAIEQRTYQDELCHLITLGLEQKQSVYRKESLDEPRPISSGEAAPKSPPSPAVESRRRPSRQPATLGQGMR